MAARSENEASISYVLRPMDKGATLGSVSPLFRGWGGAEEFQH